jgi:hypothetical protein
VFVHKKIGAVAADSFPRCAAELSTQHHVYASGFANVAARQGITLTDQAAATAEITATTLLLSRSVQCKCGALKYKETVTFEDLLLKKVSLTFTAVPKVNSSSTGSALHRPGCAVTSRDRLPLSTTVALKQISAIPLATPAHVSRLRTAPGVQDEDGISVHAAALGGISLKRVQGGMKSARASRRGGASPFTATHNALLRNLGDAIDEGRLNEHTVILYHPSPNTATTDATDPDGQYYVAGASKWPTSSCDISCLLI